MSLDVYLHRKRYLSYDEGKTYSKDLEQVYWANITHNLGKMAHHAGIYEALWRPYTLHPEYVKKENHQEEYDFKESTEILACQIAEPIKVGLERLVNGRKTFERFNPENGWGSWDGLVKFCKQYLDALIEFPNSIVTVSR